MPEASDALDDLAHVIHLSIKARGLYVLMDQRLKHICGDGYADDTSANRDAIAEFARKNDLAWRRTEGMVVFTPLSP
jgi:hypothetical protein